MLEDFKTNIAQDLFYSWSGDIGFFTEWPTGVHANTLASLDY